MADEQVIALERELTELAVTTICDADRLRAGGRKYRPAYEEEYPPNLDEEAIVYAPDDRPDEAAFEVEVWITVTRREPTPPAQPEVDPNQLTLDGPGVAGV